MTLKPIESEFSELLLEQSKNENLPLDLRQNSIPVEKFTPKVLWEKLLAERHIDSQVALTPPDWNLVAFPNIEVAQKHVDSTLKIAGKPFEIYKFLSSGTKVALIDFAPIGAALLSKDKIEAPRVTGLHEKLIPVWLSYALSPELWGENGKWTRFHSRLHQLFKEKGLLIGDDFPGYYPLKEETESLAKAGFQGTKLENSYLLVLPWSFSLTALQKLEEVIREEF